MTPTLDDLLCGLRVVSMPLTVPFRGIRHREVALLRGPAGWGEFGPFLEYGPAEAARWLGSAIECAWQGLPEPVRAEVAVNATVPAVPAADVDSVLARFDGCTTAKVKVAERGQSLDEDVARVAQVRSSMGPHARIRVDANGAWSLDDARAALARLARHDLEYAEQPCAAVEDLARLRTALARDGIDVPVAADESIRKADDPLRVAALGAADVVVVKVAPLGGPRRALEVVEACGLPAVVSSALDSSVGIAAGVALAAALPSLPFACGLGTVSLLADDVTSAPRRASGGVLRPGPVDPDRLDAVAAPADRVAWWRARVADAHPHLPPR